MNLPSTNVLVQVTFNGLLTGGVYALMASGLTLIFGVMRVINIAHGAFLILSAYIAYWLFTNFGLDPILSIALTVPLFFLLGMFVQRALLSRQQGDPGFTVLVTFALALFLDGMMGSLWNTTQRTVRTSYTTKVYELLISDVNLRVPLVRLAGFGAAIVALILLYFLLMRSSLGRAIRATIQNHDAAQLVGVNVSRVQNMTMGIGLASVAIGGALFSLIWSFNSASNTAWIAKMLSVIVLGGMGSLPGALIAALIMGVVEALASVTLRVYISPIVFYVILFLTLLFRPQGLMGTRVREG